MTMNGAQKQNSMMATSSVGGGFRTSLATRSEFLSLLQRAQPL